MRLFNKKIGYLISSVILGVAMVGCSGGGKCDSNVNPSPTVTPSPTPGELSLTLSAPDQYPAGMPTPITAYLTMTNTSTVDANNLTYAIPNEDNHTGVTITVENGNNQPCLNIPAGKSCTFPAVIGANANPGSFKVTATPNSSSFISKALFASNTLSLTANIGLTDVPVNTNSGANGISFLYAHKITGSTNSDTLISIVGVVSSAEAGSFNTLNLTDASGNLLNYEVLSGNSGNGLTNLVQGSIVTFLLTIPANSTNYSFYAQTMHDGTVVSQGSDKNIITLAEANQGVLVVQPTEFKLSASADYTSQIITYTNIGNGVVSNLNITEPEAPITIEKNNCTSTLEAGASCTVVLSSSAAAGVSGSGSLKAEYSNGSATDIILSQYNYSGANAIFGLDVETVGGFDFVTDTIDTVKSKQVTIRNTGNVSESNFVFTFEEAAGFTLSSGISSSCVISDGNKVAQTLGVNDSCTVTLTYTNSTIGNGSGHMVINYLYNGNLQATPIIKDVSYETVQATSNLGFNPSSPYRFDTIIANNQESLTTVFTVTNNGSDVVNGSLTTTITGANVAQFSLLPSTGANDCQTKANLDVGQTCTISVRFGPTLVESTAMTATLNITGSSKTGGAIDAKLVLNGATRAPKSANPVITEVVFAPAPVGGNGYQESQAYMFESSDTIQPLLTIKYQNIGDTDANDFVVVEPTMPGYSFVSKTCDNNFILESDSKNSCDVQYQLILEPAGAKNVDLTRLTASWTDESATVTNALAPWEVNGVNYNNIYINIFNKPSVMAVLSSESTGTPEITQVNLESNFYAVFKLTGGYQVGNTTYTATAPAGFNPTSGSCVLSSNNPICSVMFTAPSAAATNQEIDFTTTSGIALSPESLAINVKPPSSWYYEGETANDVAVGALAFAIDGKGRQYVTYMQSDGAMPPNYYSVITKTFNGSSWDTICGSTTLKILGLEGSFDLAINPQTDVPYIVYADSEFPSNKARATVVKCDLGGSTWDTIGTAGFMGDTQTVPVKIGFAKGSTNPTVVASVSNNAAGCNGTLDSGSRRPSLKAYTWNGSTWAQQGGCFGYGNASRISLAFNQGGANSYPYVGYTISETFLNSNRPSMIAWNGSAWVDVKNSGASMPFVTAEGATGVSIGFPLDSDTPYFAYAISSNKDLIVQSYDGTNWTNVGTNGLVVNMSVSGGSSSPPGINMTFDSNANPYVVYAWVDPNTSPSTYYSGVKFFDTYGTGSWVSYGTPLPMRSVTPGFVFDSMTDVPYIAFSNYDENNYISVVGSSI